MVLYVSVSLILWVVLFCWFWDRVVRDIFFIFSSPLVPKPSSSRVLKWLTHDIVEKNIEKTYSFFKSRVHEIEKNKRRTTLKK